MVQDLHLYIAHNK